MKPKQTKEGWEKEFDSKFTDRGNYVYQVEIKDFIRNVRQQAIKETLEKIENKSADKESIYYGYGRWDKLKSQLLGIED